MSDHGCCSFPGRVYISSADLRTGNDGSLADAVLTTLVWSRDALRQKTDLLLNVLENAGNADSTESSQVNLAEFGDVIEAWSIQAVTDGVEAADSACGLLEALEQKMDQLAVDNLFLTWDVAWYNNVMHAYAVSSGGRDAAEKAEAILRGMLTKCCVHQSSKSFPAPVEPTTTSFNIAINAWAKSGEHDSGKRAEQIFTRMEEWLVECKDRHGLNGAAPNARTLSGVMDAWAQSGAQKAEERVLRILMHAIHKRRKFLVARRDGESPVEESCIKPNVIMFNSAIHAWVNSGRGRVGAEKTEEILRMMEQLNESGELGETKEYDEDDVGLKPTTKTLSLIVDAWAECEKVDKTGEAASRAQHFLNLMEQLFREGHDIKPNYVTFTSCIAAWSRSERVNDAAERAEALLDRMLDLYRETGDADFKPTVVTGNAVISAWAKSRHTQSAERAEAVLKRLNDFCTPDTYSYNSTLNAHANKGNSLAAKNLLKQMEQAYNSGSTTICPDEVTYNTVIYALSTNFRQGNAEEAEGLLERMKTMYKEGRADVKPTPRTYTTVIRAWGRSKDPKQAEKAHKVLKSMIDEYKRGDKSLKPDVYAFTAFINVCAKTDVKHVKESRSALRMAIQAFEEMKQSSDYDNPSSVTYVALMKACSQLSRDPSERSRLMQSIFQQCCQDGMLSKLVLVLLKQHVPGEVLVELKIEGDSRENSEKWSRNVPRKDRP